MNLDRLKQLLLLSPVPAVLVGILLLMVGRKFFWLFVAVIGFVAGVDAVTPMAPQGSGWVLAGGLVCGALGAVLAILVQKVAVAVAGFLAGGYSLMIALRGVPVFSPDYGWVFFLAGGVVGAFLMIYVFNWSLILFSSICGAHMIVQAFPSSPTTALTIFGVLLVAGCIVQGRALTVRTTHEV